MYATRFLALLVVGLGLLAAGLPLAGQAKQLLNVDGKGVAVQGYDQSLTSLRGKQSRRFPIPEQLCGGYILPSVQCRYKEAFDKEPAKYAPQYGGYCAMAMTMGKLEDVDPNYFLVHDSKLLLQRNEKAYTMFGMDPYANHKKADDNWAKMQRIK